MTYLGIDLGTSGLEALLMDAAGQVIGSQAAPLVANHPQIGWSEQDPAARIAASNQALDRLVLDLAKAKVAVRAVPRFRRSPVLSPSPSLLR
ncbi:MAG: hypothetical protein KDJ74_16845 [Notoacmeibacter sp.]|nr:hypothetical protein [Notoacmeibacter sp.]